MRASTTKARPPRARLILLGFLVCAAVGLAGCGTNSSPTTPIVKAPGPPGPMITILGDPRVSVTFQGFVNRTTGQDTLSGYFYVVILDSLNRRTFISGVTMNGAPMR